MHARRWRCVPALYKCRWYKKESAPEPMRAVLQGRQDSLALIPGSWASVTAEQFFLY